MSQPSAPSNVVTPTKNGQSTPQLWTDKELAILEEHRVYSDDLNTYVCDLMCSGFIDGRLPPKPPKTSLKTLLGGSTQKPKLLGKDLHAYLLSHVVSESPALIVPVLNEVRSNIKTLANIEPYLVEGCNIFNKSLSHSLSVSLHLGAFLDLAFEMHRLEKNVGTWSEFVKKRLNLSISWDGKLRTIFKMFGPYKEMHKLALPFCEIYNRRNDLRNLFITDCEVANLWIGDRLPVAQLSNAV